MTADGPRLVDWTCTVRAPAAFDLVVCRMLLCEIVPESLSDPQRPLAYHAVMHAEYARLAGMSPAALTAATKPYLPIARVVFLLWGGAQGPLRERLIQRVEADLRSED